MNIIQFFDEISLIIGGWEYMGDISGRAKKKRKPKYIPKKVKKLLLKRCQYNKNWGK